MATLQFTEGPDPPRPLTARKQLLNHIVDGLAHTRPESVWAKIPLSTGYTNGHIRVTYRRLANAVNGIAWWLSEQLGQSSTFETIAYFGVWDPRYIIVLLGAVKAGYKVVLPSLTYGLTGLTKLLDRLQCLSILASSIELPIISRLKSSRTVYQIPSLNELLDTSYAHFSFDKTFLKARSEPLVVVHTSGTTGDPKPIVWTHDWAASWIHQNQMAGPEGFETMENVFNGVELCAVSPPNHSSSLFPNLLVAIPNATTVLYPMPQSPLTVDTAMDMIRHNNPTVLIAPPHILSDIASNSEHIRAMTSKVAYIGGGGGPIPQQVGNTLSKHFRVFGLYGTSEIGVIHKIRPMGSWSWNSFIPHPKEGIEFRHHHEGRYEAVVVRNSNSEDEQPVFKLFPEQAEWATKDLFQIDQESKGAWIYSGRLDDVIILSNGATIHPMAYEHKVASASFVTQAVMCGNGKLHPGLLVQLSSEYDKVQEQLGALVEACNDQFPPQLSISKHRIILADADRPLPVSAKGAVQRNGALKLYQAEIDRVL